MSRLKNSITPSTSSPRSMASQRRCAGRHARRWTPAGSCRPARCREPTPARRSPRRVQADPSHGRSVIRRLWAMNSSNSAGRSCQLLTQRTVVASPIHLPQCAVLPAEGPGRRHGACAERHRRAMPTLPARTPSRRPSAGGECEPPAAGRLRTTRAHASRLPPARLPGGSRLSESGARGRFAPLRCRTTFVSPYHPGPFPG